MFLFSSLQSRLRNNLRNKHDRETNMRDRSVLDTEQATPLTPSSYEHLSKGTYHHPPSLASSTPSTPNATAAAGFCPASRHIQKQPTRATPRTHHATLTSSRIQTQQAGLEAARRLGARKRTPAIATGSASPALPRPYIAVPRALYVRCDMHLCGLAHARSDTLACMHMTGCALPYPILYGAPASRRRRRRRRRLRRVLAIARFCGCVSML